jgi:hypothetical protein
MGAVLGVVVPAEAPRRKLAVHPESCHSGVQAKAREPGIQTRAPGLGLESGSPPRNDCDKF